MQVKAAAVLVGSSGIGQWQDLELEAIIQQLRGRKAPIIPVLLPGVAERPALPPFLSSYSWVDLRPRLTRPGIERLIWGITRTKQDNAETTNKAPDEVTAGLDGETRDNLTKLVRDYLTSRDFEHCDEILEHLDECAEDPGEVTWLHHIVDFERSCTEAVEATAQRFRARAMVHYRCAVDLSPRFKLFPNNEYNIIEPLGFGGISHVYLATKDGAEFAVKSIRSELLANVVMTNDHAKSLPRIQRMTELAQEEDGVGIARIIEAHTSETKVVIVYERVHGTSLDRHLKGTSADILAHHEHYVRCLCLLERVCESLAFAHRQGIVHLDVSPSNILIVGNHNRWDDQSQIKLIDFDTARVATGAWGASHTNVLTAGTARYMDPLFLASPLARGAANPTCDLYSVAMLAKAMLCGRPEAVESPSDVSPSAPPVLDELISASTSDDLFDRLDSAEEMKKCFRFLLDMADGSVWRGLHRTIIVSMSAVFLCCLAVVALKLYNAESFDTRIEILAPVVGMLCASWAYFVIIKGWFITDRVLQDNLQRLFTAATLVAWLLCVAGAVWQPRYYFLFFAGVQFAAATRGMLYYGVKTDLGALRSWRMERFGVFACVGSGIACIAGYVAARAGREHAAILGMSFNTFVLLFGIGAAISAARDARIHFAVLSRATGWRYMIDLASRSCPRK